MIAIIASFTVAEGKEEAFEAEFAELTAKVRANEPGNSLYQLTRSKKDRQTYRMMELYADKDAVKAHGTTDYFAASFDRIKALLTAEPVIELLDSVG
ncbi:putative quinol monooxygenase [Sphingobium sp. Sx8-8]|uniref:putative quinol monooxygenase n=1 Tax=Sphingobium sp. Sx8-8 TaxID=2933617 RepID=UPI001F5A40D0|nr:putative quinol monooxygenase [Sphingobium sp. Sx8-8]